MSKRKKALPAKIQRAILFRLFHMREVNYDETEVKNFLPSRIRQAIVWHLDAMRRWDSRVYEIEELRAQRDELRRIIDYIRSTH